MSHIPVLLPEVIEALAPRDGEAYVDGTFGGGGYAMRVLGAADCKLYGIDRDFDATFSVDLLCKDNGLALDMARSFGAPLPLAGAIQTMNETAVAQGLGAEDTSALVKVYETMFGIAGN